MGSRNEAALDKTIIDIRPATRRHTTLTLTVPIFATWPSYKVEPQALILILRKAEKLGLNQAIEWIWVQAVYKSLTQVAVYD